MTLPVYGNSLSLNQIATEFGGTGALALENYYAGGSYVTSGTVGYPTGGSSVAIPSSGAISIANFYGASGVVTPPTWTGPNQVTSGLNLTLSSSSAMCFGNNVFIAVGKNNSSGKGIVIYTSGTTWGGTTDVTNTVMFQSVCFGNGYFIAAGYNYSSPNTYIAIFYSSNGSTWSSGTSINSGSSTVELYTSCYLPGTGYIVMGIIAGNTYPVYMIGSSTTSWPGSLSNMYATNPSFTPFGSATNGTNVVAVGTTTSSYASYAVYSGGSWQGSGPTAFAGSHAVSGDISIAYGSGTYVVVFQTSSYSYVTTSTDGVTWTTPTTIATTSTLGATGICYGGGLFLITGTIGAANKVAYSWSSNNGSTWSTPSTMPNTISTSAFGAQPVSGNISGTTYFVTGQCVSNSDFYSGHAP